MHQRGAWFITNQCRFDLLIELRTELADLGPIRVLGVGVGIRADGQRQRLTVA